MGRKRIVWGMMAALALSAAVSAFGQDEGPTLRPKAQAKPKASGGTILVMCDLACNWKLDGEAMGALEAGGSRKASVSLGEHHVDGATADDLDKTGKDVAVKTTAQVIVHIDLQPVRDVRVQMEQDSRAKAAAQQEELNRAALDQQKNAAEQAQQGAALMDQKQYAEAQPLLQQACGGGNMDGCKNLGRLYQFGQGVARDYVQARTLYRKACDGGNIDSCYTLSTLRFPGMTQEEVEQTHALKLKACDAGIMRACVDAGTLYQFGHDGVVQDYRQAHRFFEKACDGGYLPGCYHLGSLDFPGMTQQDTEQAHRSLQKACDGGLEAACDALKNLPPSSAAGADAGSGDNCCGDVEHVGGDVSAPVVIFTPPLPGFTQEALQNKLQGDVVVKFIVDAQGNPRNPQVMHGLGEGLDEKALEAVMRYRFKPAMRNGRPVAVYLALSITFQLK